MNGAPASEWTAIAWQGGVEDAALAVVDRRARPPGSQTRSLTSLAAVLAAIRSGSVAGVGNLAIAAAYAVPLHVFTKARGRRCSNERLEDLVVEACARLSDALPEVLPAQRSLKRLRECFDRHVGKLTALEVGARLLMEARRFHREAGELGQRIAQLGLQVLPQSGTILVVGACGALAYPSPGTGLAILQAARREGRNLDLAVLADSDGGTTAVEWGEVPSWDLAAVGRALKAQNLSAVLLAADRVTAAGDLVTPPGSYIVAALAKAHGIPVLAAAPYTCFDFSSDHAEDGPGHDAVPADLVDAVVTGRGVIRRPTRAAVEALMADPSDPGPAV